MARFKDKKEGWLIFFLVLVIFVFFAPIIVFIDWLKKKLIPGYISDLFDDNYEEYVWN